ncbi:MAG: hypothetical protein R6V05_07325 [Candidatus Brocadiia bacterium]
MYPLKPLKVYALDRVRQNERWAARMERILAGAGRTRADVRWVTEENLPDVMGELSGLWPPDDPPDGVPLPYLRPLVFTVMELSDEPPDLDPVLARCPDGTNRNALAKVLGRSPLVRPTHPRQVDEERDQVCWPTHDFGAMRGCPHGCRYCAEGNDGRFIAVGVNLEEYMEQVVGPTIERYPWQRCFRMIGWGSDLIAFEPENGLFDLFTRKIAEYEGHYGYFHTASDNVDWIADLPRKDRLIGVWSLTCDAVARQIEPGSGPALKRIEAGRRCQEMGLPVRYKFKPIIPVRGWREEYAPVIRAALTRSRPESLGMCVLMWMDYASLTEKIAPDLLDPEFAEAARESAEELEGVRTGPFPHELRAQVYRFFIREARRHDEDVPLYVSTESREMWDELTDELGQEPGAYVCGCSPVALPGGRLALSKGCPASTYRWPRASAGPK